MGTLFGTEPILFDTSIIAMMRFDKLFCAELMIRHSMSPKIPSLPGTASRVDVETGIHWKIGSLGIQLAMIRCGVRRLCLDAQFDWSSKISFHRFTMSRMSAAENRLQRIFPRM